MEPEATRFLFNLLGWMILAICVLYGIARATPVGAFRALWSCVSLYFAVRIADRLPAGAGGLMAEHLGTTGLQSEVLGYWAVVALVMIMSAIWLRFAENTRVVVPPIIEQIATPVLGGLAGLLLGIAVFQSLLVSDWARNSMTAPMTVTRGWMAALELRWFPHERPEAAADAQAPAAVPAPATPAAPAAKPTSQPATEPTLSPPARQFIP